MAELAQDKLQRRRRKYLLVFAFLPFIAAFTALCVMLTGVHVKDEEDERYGTSGFASFGGEIISDQRSSVPSIAPSFLRASIADVPNETVAASQTNIPTSSGDILDSVSESLGDVVDVVSESEQTNPLQLNDDTVINAPQQTNTTSIDCESYLTTRQECIASTQCEWFSEKGMHGFCLFRPPSILIDCLDPDTSEKECIDAFHCEWVVRDKGSKYCQFLPMMNACLMSGEVCDERTDMCCTGLCAKDGKCK